MTPTLEQLQAMTDDQLNAAAAQALGWRRIPKKIRSFIPTTRTADAMSLPMDGYECVFEEGEVTVSNFSIPSIEVHGPREKLPRLLTIFFLLTRREL